MPRTLSRAVALMLTVVALAAPSALADTVLHCGLLLDRPGHPPRAEVTLHLRDGRVVGVLDGYNDADDIAPGADTIDLRDRFVMPGLIDCHTHITHEMAKGARLSNAVLKSEADTTINATVYATRTLMAGFTTIRNVGSSGDVAFALRDAINAGTIPGPRILAAGHSITPTGGHGDSTHGFREGLFEMPGAYQGVADGPDACRKAVRAQVKRGSDVIKITATGGVLSRTNAGTGQQLFDDELVAIVEAAHALGRKVAAHAHGVEGINAALRAGVDSIEHGSFLDAESISLFKNNGAYVVPTLLAGETVATIAREDPDYFIPAVRAKALAVGPEMMSHFRGAVEGGVNIAFGTDSGVSKHGENAREFELMVEAGMTPEAALAAATVAAAELCGLGEEIGSLESGKAADIVAIEGNPLEDISAMWDVVFVMKGGVVHRQD